MFPIVATILLISPSPQVTPNVAITSPTPPLPQINPTVFACFPTSPPPQAIHSVTITNPNSIPPPPPEPPPCIGQFAPAPLEDRWITDCNSSPFPSIFPQPSLEDETVLKRGRGDETHRQTERQTLPTPIPLSFPLPLLQCVRALISPSPSPTCHSYCYSTGR